MPAKRSGGVVPRLEDLDDNSRVPSEWFAFYLGVSPKTLRNWVSAGRVDKPLEKENPRGRSYWRARVVRALLKKANG